MKNDFTEEELKQINRELAELRKHIEENKKRHIIGPDVFFLAANEGR